MALQYDALLKRVTRQEAWQDLTASTYRRIQEAIRGQDYALAARYVDYFHEEALVCRRLFDQWLTDLPQYFTSKGLAEETFDAALARILRLIAPMDRSPWDREGAWNTYLGLKQALRSALEGPAPVEPSLMHALLRMKEEWRIVHDLDVDLLLGFFDVVMDELGETAIGELWEQHLIRDWFDQRYARFDVSRNNWEESFRLLVFLSFEAMHGHLCGPAREGDVEFTEFDDRVELRFDPCGSGGRAYRGEPLDGTGPRMEPPYGFKAVQGAYDFTWNKKGICTYCVHCCVLTEKLPAKAFGYPVRVIDPPSYPHAAGAKCQYTIYKDVRAIPSHVYERIGLTKPTPDQPLGSAYGPFGKK